MLTDAHSGPAAAEREAADLGESNRMEVLLFSLGTGETFGINVFKVREVTRGTRITRTPNMPAGVPGVISLRGAVIPVLDLSAFVAGCSAEPQDAPVLIVTEFCRRTQALLVDAVDRIVRVDWAAVCAPDPGLSDDDQLVTALTRLPDGRLVSILDVEQVLVSAFGEPHVPDLDPIAAGAGTTALFVDDSQVARREIAQVLDKLGIAHQQAANGREAWEKLQGAAAHAQSEGVALAERLKLVLTDAEMPEMNGYALTRLIRSDPRFDGIPVVMYSSLCAQANHTMGNHVGVSAYVDKFNPVTLAETLRPLLAA